MYTEFEATFANIDKNKIRKILKSAGANLIKREFLQKRVVFNFPKGHEIKGAWARVRDEGDKITMSIKIVDGDKIENQKEIELKVDSFENAVNFLETSGFDKKAFQETRREKWDLGGVDITIDEWPFLEPFVEIEADSEDKVKKIAKKLGFDYATAYFGAVDELYAKKYGVTVNQINNHTPKILFEGKNPFIK